MDIALLEMLAKSGLREGEEGSFALPLSGIERIKIDVGLSLDAPHSISWLQNDPNLLVIGFEPVKECIESIQALLQQEDMQNVRDRFVLIQCALSDHNGEAPFFVTEDFGTSSLESPLGFASRRIEAVQVFRLDDIAEVLDFGTITRVDYLKTDCQGHDLRVLEGAQKLLERTAVVTCEAWAPGYDMPRVDSELQITNFLNRLGFASLNRKSTWRIHLSSFLHNSKMLSLLRPKLENAFVRIAKVRKTAIADEIGGHLPPKLGASDPTFLNSRFLNSFHKGEITYYQTF